MARSSNLFQPFRAVGFVTDATPISVQKLDNESFATVAVGKSFTVYSCDRLRTFRTSPSCPRRITALASAVGHRTFAAVGASVLVYRDIEHIFTLPHDSDVTHLLSLGELLVTVSSSLMQVWDIGAAFAALEDKVSKSSVSVLSCLACMELPLDDCVSALMHPHAYLNKVVLGFTSGAVEIWNISSCRRVYRLRERAHAGAVVCIAQSPLVDVVAIADASGAIDVHNLRTDAAVMSFSHVGVTSLAFHAQTLVSASSDGSLALWALDKRRLLVLHRAAHDDRIGHIVFVPGEPLLLSSGADNALKLWVLESDDVRLLRARSGHALPPTRVRFAAARTLLSAAGTELRRADVYNPLANVRFGRARSATQPITALTCADGLSRFADVVTCHADADAACTWRVKNRAGADVKLVVDAGDVALSVALSACRNFVVVGTQRGLVHIFNVQSGLRRGSLPAHNSAVVAVAVDALNGVVVSCARDGELRFSSFKQKRELGVLQLPASIACAELCRANGLLAVAADDLVVYVLDVTSRRIVRRCGGHRNRVTDLAFSGDGRAIATSSMDAGVRVFDLASGVLVDWMRFSKPVTSVAFSPANDFLATTHVNSVAVFLWANRAHFSNVFLQAVAHAPVDMKVSTSASLCIERADDVASSSPPSSSSESVTVCEAAFASVGFDAASDDELVSLSGLPPSRWKALATLDVVKERNKPSQPVKSGIDAPFFLPTLSGVEPTLDIASALESDNAFDAAAATPASRRASVAASLGALLAARDFDGVRRLLLSASASAVDGMIRSLGFEPDEELNELGSMLDYFGVELSSQRNFEVVQAQLDVFLRAHQSSLARLEPLQTKLQALQPQQRDAWRRLEHNFHSSMCMLAFFSGIQL